jgi:hypothetical protein
MNCTRINCYDSVILLSMMAVFLVISTVGKV